MNAGSGGLGTVAPARYTKRMGAVFNAIVPGTGWAQTFQFKSAPLGAGELMRANFRYGTAGALLLQLDEPVGIARNGNDFTVSLTAAQTTAMDGHPKVSFDLYGVQGGVPRHLQLRVDVPIREGL